MLAVILGLGLGLIFGMLCHFYRISPWFMGNDHEDAMLHCRGRLERARARRYTLQQRGVTSTRLAG
jgi:hypothetical protein